MQWLRLFLAACLAALVGGCEPGTFCSQCKKPESCKQCPSPKPPAKIDWTGLSEELKKVEFGGDVTINVEAAEFDVKPGEDAWKVEIANWDKLTDELRQIMTANDAQAKHYALVHQLHTMLAERQSPETYNYWIWGLPVSDNRIPPPVKACPALAKLRIFVFFPHEAAFKDWEKHQYAEACDSPSPVCPNLDLFEEHVDEFIDVLAKCSGDEVIKLQVRGFASSSGINVDDEDKVILKEEFGERSVKKSCVKTANYQARKSDVEENEETRMLNLLVSELRAKNVADMLKGGFSEEKVSVEIQSAVWCSHKDMAWARKVDDIVDGEYDTFTGMLNRRVEIRVVAPQQ